MAALVDGGFSPEEAAHAYRALFAYTFGYAAYGPREHGAADEAATLATLLDIAAGRVPGAQRGREGRRRAWRESVRAGAERATRRTAS